MIRFSLRCKPEGHGYDGWFRSSEDFEAQAAKGLVSCPVCGASAVEKAPMAPAVNSSRAKEARGAVMNAEAAKALAQLQEMARQVRANGDYVGPQFAEEARKIHYGEADRRQIYGEASTAEVKELAGEGIAAFPMPPLPEDQN
ncbi:DUF1178 family protein [Consotaella salsifontis]|uniref:Uncharacterized protein n=1 Tax=Consotaella salsifontis TaxID=1365950 RepID=A0A1T4QLL8_9HYPH|nr:DUF1178 family protein [Consotaella salsifontis]SKA04576.1 hypothetical protein SAMN05428963_105117 [Consotaella salsifontis]